MVRAHYAAAVPAFAANVTVGRFYSELAQAKRIVAVDGPSAEAGLRIAGFNLPKLDLNKSLTEGEMTAISKALGVAVTTERPAQFVSEAQLGTYMSSFGDQIGKPAKTAVDPFSLNGAKGKKKGHHKSTSEPI